MDRGRLFSGFLQLTLLFFAARCNMINQRQNASLIPERPSRYLPQTGGAVKTYAPELLARRVLLK